MESKLKRRRSDVGTAMHKKSLVKRLSAPTITIAEVDGRMTQSCTIRFLDDSEPMSLHFKKDTRGQEIMDEVCQQLDLAENDYFGLRYVDIEKQRHWLDMTKTVHRQMRNVKLPFVLCFRVKFYPSDPTQLKEEITRYFLFLQLRRDLHHGRLLCSPAKANQLAAYIVQSECGDYDNDEESAADYVGRCRMLPKLSDGQQSHIAEIHQSLIGQTPNVAEMNFLVAATQLDTYAVDPHPVKDQNGSQMYLGVTHIGIITFQGSKKKQMLRWPSITKITYEGKVFIVHVTANEKKNASGFKCPTIAACKHLWKCAVEQQYFFTQQSTAEAPRVASAGGLFNRASRLRLSGRCEYEAVNDSLPPTRRQPHILRTTPSLHSVDSWSFKRHHDLMANTFSALNDSETSLSSDGRDAASQSLDLDWSTTLSRDPSSERPQINDPSPSDRRQPTIEDSESEDDEPVRQQRDSPTAADGDLSLTSHDTRPMNHDTRSVAGDDAAVTADTDAVGEFADDEAADTFSDALETSHDADSVTDSCVSADTVAHATSLDRSEFVHDTRPLTLCNGRVTTEHHLSSPSSSSWSSWLVVLLLAVALAILFVVCGLVVLTYIVLESDVDAGVVRSIRGLPEVCEFYRDKYFPWRRLIFGLPDREVVRVRWQCMSKTKETSGRAQQQQQHRSTSTFQQHRVTSDL